MGTNGGKMTALPAGAAIEYLEVCVLKIIYWAKFPKLKEIGPFSMVSRIGGDGFGKTGI